MNDPVRQALEAGLDMPGPDVLRLWEQARQYVDDVVMLYSDLSHLAGENADKARFQQGFEDASDLLRSCAWTEPNRAEDVIREYRALRAELKTIRRALS
ncbi:hypothetical protein ACWEKT_35930 [Nocardia takedensis]